MRTMHEKMMGLPAETGGVLDNERLFEKLDLQEQQYRARNLDPALQKKAEELINELHPGDINITPLIVKHELVSYYLHNALIQRGYRQIPNDGHDTGFHKNRIYSIPEIPLERCRAVLRKFKIKEV